MFKNLILNLLIRMLPDWSDAEATRLFVLKIIGYLADLAASTATSIDDAVLAALQKFAASPEAWASLHRLILEMLTDSGNEWIPGESHPAVMKLADDTKIDPVTIVAIITAIIEIIKMWRDRRNKEEAEATA